MYVGNVILLVLNLPLAGMFATLLRVRYTLLYPVILALCIAHGRLQPANSADDLWVMTAFGVVGYLMKKYDFPIAPLVLGPGARTHAGNRVAPNNDVVPRQSRDLPTRPISAALIVLKAVLILMTGAAHARARLPPRRNQ